MRYEEFVQEMYQRIQEILKDEYQVSMEEMIKCNDIRQRKLMLTCKEKQVSPAISMEQFFEMYQSGISLEDCVRAILDCMEEAEQKSDTETWGEMVSSWVTARKRVYPMLVSKERNKEFLKDLVWRPFLDLAVCYVLIFPLDQGWGNVKIQKEHLTLWGVTEEKLIMQAEKNNLDHGYELKIIEDVLLEFMGGGIKKQEYMQDNKIYVLGNQEKLYGAAKLLCSSLMRKISNGKNFWILPSSLHELILVPEVFELEKEELNKMIQEINTEKIAEWEILSDHAYFYDAETESIKM